MKIASLTLKDKEERRLVRGHLWAYRNELQADPVLEDGALVDLFAANRRFVARGFYQAQGGIGARILTRRQEEIDAAFFARALETALALRTQVFPGSTAYRWVFGESDGLPGLVIDRYGSVAVAQTACAFYARQAEHIAAAVLATEGVQGLILEAPSTPEAPARRTFGEVAEEAEVDLGGLRLHVPLQGGQKTGMFLDQRVNAQMAAPLAAGLRVYDAHANTGQWALRMALAGAAHVHVGDTSKAALDLAARNAALNGVEGVCTFENLPAEEVLARGQEFGMIVLDPPAFAKARAQGPKALGRYQALNRAAIKALAPGGYLVSCSCSHFVAPEDFVETLKRAAIAEQRTLQMLDFRGAAPDHPLLLTMPETDYLKCAVMRVL